MSTEWRAKFHDVHVSHFNRSNQLVPLNFCGTEWHGSGGPNSWNELGLLRCNSWISLSSLSLLGEALYETQFSHIANGFKTSCSNKPKEQSPTCGSKQLVCIFQFLLSPLYHPP